MKRLTLILSIILILTMMASSQSITVTSPNGGETLKRGNNFSIAWTSSGVSGNVNLILWKGSSNLGQIAQNKPANGSFSWHVGDALVNPPGTTYPDGSNFKIMVKSITDWTISDQSNGNFTISNTRTTTYTAVTTVQAEIPPIRGNAELSIVSVSRADRNHLRAGDPLNLIVQVKNHSGWSANICIATPGEKSENFYFKGECGVINGGATRSYSISVPFKRQRMKDGNLTSTVFIVDANKRGTLFQVTWKDSNTRNNYHSFSLPYELPDLIVTEIVKVRTYNRNKDFKYRWSEADIKIKNRGNYASHPGKIRLKALDPSYFGGTASYNGHPSFDIPAVAVGETRTVTLQLSGDLMGHISRDGVKLEIWVNSTSSIIESNYTNNKLIVVGKTIPETRSERPKPSTF